MKIKEFKAIGEKSGLRENPKNVLQGNYKGYATMVQYLTTNAGVYLTVIGIPGEDTADSDAIQGLLDRVRTTPGVEACNLDTNCIKVIFRNAKTANANTVLDCADMIVRHYSEYGYKSGCVHCGNTEQHTALCGVNGSLQYLCDDCYSEAYAQNAQSVESVKQRKNNMPAGLVGALIGSLIGVALWVVLGYVGFIAGLAGLVMIVCALKGYEMLGGKPRKKEIIIILIMCAIMIIVAEGIALAIEAYEVFGEQYDITFFDALSITPELMVHPDIIGGVIFDIVIGYALTAWASFATIKNTLSNTGEQVTVQKYE